MKKSESMLPRFVISYTNGDVQKKYHVMTYEQWCSLVEQPNFCLYPGGDLYNKIFFTYITEYGEVRLLDGEMEVYIPL
mgnify:CR=1 FL=1